MLKSIGLPELLVILVVALLLFGGKKIPEVAKGLGEGIRNFKSSLKGEEEHPDDQQVYGRQPAQAVRPDAQAAAGLAGEKDRDDGAQAGHHSQTQRDMRFGEIRRQSQRMLSRLP